jgi:PPM family protein phosphatase
MEFKVEVAGLSDVGMVRERNEDNFLVDEGLSLFVVADGMGGHVGGQMASGIAVKQLGEFIAQQNAQIVAGQAAEPLESSAVPRILADAVRMACSAIFKTAQDDATLHGMGTTVTALLIRAGRAFIAHVGDSRAYLQRGDRIIQVTEDHSLVNEQIKAGILTQEQARMSRYKNIITRSVGFERDVAVDTFALPLEDGDRFLMCSDGLANFVDDTEIGRSLAYTDIKDVPRSMIALANSRGGDDNITVIAAKVTRLSA